MSPNLDGCPPQSWQFGVIIVPFGILNFAFSLLEEFLTIDKTVFLNLTVIRSLFSRLFFNIAACKLHVV